MGNAAAGGLEQEPAENSAGTASGMSDPVPALQKKQPAPPKLPMPPEEELEERFNVVLVSCCTGHKMVHDKWCSCVQVYLHYSHGEGYRGLNMQVCQRQKYMYIVINYLKLVVR